MTVSYKFWTQRQINLVNQDHNFQLFSKFNRDSRLKPRNSVSTVNLFNLTATQICLARLVQTLLKWKGSSNQLKIILKSDLAQTIEIVLCGDACF